MTWLLGLALAGAPLEPPPTYQEPVTGECPVLAATSPALPAALPCDGLLLPSADHRYLLRAEQWGRYCGERHRLDADTAAARVAEVTTWGQEWQARAVELEQRADRRERMARLDGTARGLLIGAGVGLVGGLLVAAVAR